MSLLRAEAVTWRVGERMIVDSVDLELRAGEVVSLVGPNGAGKSTLVRLLSGDLAPDDGVVRLGGLPLDGMSAPEQARVRAVMPQHTTLRFAFTVRQVVTMGCYARVPDGRDEEVVDAALREADVLDLAERSFPTLSGGEQSLATLARVLAQEARVLLLDEPTASLDLRHRALVMDLARRAADGGAAVCVVAHDLNLAAAHSDRIVLMHLGRVVCDGRPWEAMTEERLSGVFEHPVRVTRSPVGDHPLVTPCVSAQVRVAAY